MAVATIWNQLYLVKSSVLKFFSLKQSLNSQRCHLDLSVQCSDMNISSCAFWFQGGCGGLASFFFGGKLTRPTHPWFAVQISTWSWQTLAIVFSGIYIPSPGVFLTAACLLHHTDEEMKTDATELLVGLQIFSSWGVGLWKWCVHFFA